MNLTPRPFMDKTKPTIIPFIGDTRPSKEWEFSDYSTKSFGSQLKQNMSGSEYNDASFSQKKGFSSMVSTLQMATLKKGLDHFSLGQLSNIEFTGSKNNYEEVNQKNFIDYRSYLYTPLALLSKESIQPTDDDDDEEEEFETDEDAPAKGHTVAHNLNLYSGFAGFNPFKKADKANYNAFNSDETMQMLSSNFMSPLRVLGQDVWDAVNFHMAKLQDNSAKLEDLNDVYHDNDIEKFDVLSNYESVLRDYSEDESKRELWNENTFFSFILRRWSDAKNLYKNATLFSGKVAAHSSDMYLISQKDTILEESGEFNDYIESMDSLLGDLGTLTDTAEVGTSADGSFASEEEMAALTDDLENLLTLFEKEDSLDSAQTEALSEIQALYDNLSLPSINTKYEATDLSMLNDWWTRVGDEVPDHGMLMPIGVFAESADKIAGALELGNWEGSLDSKISQYISDEDNGFMANAFRNYINHINKYLLPVDDATDKVTPSLLAIDNVSYGKIVFDKLIENGFIDSEGTVQQKFDVNNYTIDLGVTDDYYENDRLRSVLRSATLNSFELDSIDITSTDNKYREQIKLIDPEGNSWDLESLQNLIQGGSTEYGNNPLVGEYDSARRAYNVLFDMYESMTGMNVNKEPSSGGPVINQLRDDLYEMDVYSHASWKEYDDASSITTDKYGNKNIVGAWQDSGDKPLKMQFASKRDASYFFKQIEGMIATLEPILGSFEPTSNVGPGLYGVSYQDGEAVKTRLRVINDNVGMLGDNGVVLEGTSDHKFSVDYIHHKSFFETEHWQNISDDLSEKILMKVGVGIFTDAQVNRMYKARNKRDKEDYKQMKKEHDDKEHDRIQSELKAYYTSLGKQKKYRKEHAAKVKQRFNRLKAEAKQADKLKEKRLQESRSAKKKDDKKAEGASSSKKKR
jgi:hypothetical protein